MAAQSLSVPVPSSLDLRAAAPFLVAAVALYFLMEQVSYHRKKGPLPGPALVVPFLGSVAHMIRDPTGFWDAQAARAKRSGAGLAADFLVGRFVVFIRDSELSHRVFANVRPDAFHLIGHPFGKKLFGDHNLIYMFGEDHKDLRRRIAPNFTPRACPPTPRSSSASSWRTSGGGSIGAAAAAAAGGRSPSACPAAT